MAVVVAPSTQPIPDGTNTPANVVATVVLNTGDFLDFGFVSAAADPGVTQPTFDLLLRRADSKATLINRDTSWSDTNISIRYTATGPIGVELVLVGGGFPPGARHGTAFGYHAETTLASITYCAFGTRQKDPTFQSVLLTPELIDSILTPRGMQWLAPALSVFWYTYVSVSDLCGSLPPPLPPVDSTNLSGELAAARQALNAILWPAYCECNPGTPTPVEPPLPPTAPPPGLAPPPVFACSDVDICAAIVHIQQQLAALSQTVQADYALNTAVQRYAVPFAYIRGAQHSNIRASGELAIPRLAGMLVQVTEHPDGLQVFSGTPTYVSDLGWLSILNNDGMIDEVRLTRQTQVWTPPKMALATQFGITLREGVAVNLIELEAEP